MRTRRPGLALALLAGAAAAGAMRAKMRRYEIAERSMTPALEPGDCVIAVSAVQELMRGDVVIFSHPGRSGFELVKRVVGLPAETITIANGQVHVDGAVLPEPWADGPTRSDGSWRLGAEVFVLGDQRAASAGDSREIGPVARSDVRWRVAARYWPPARIGLL